MTYVAPDTTEVVTLGGVPDPAEVEHARLRLRTEAGLGAVVLGDVASGEVTVVAHAILLGWVTRAPGESAEAWLSRFVKRVQHKSYEVVGVPATPSLPKPLLRKTAGAVRRQTKRPLHVQAMMARTRFRRQRFLWQIRKEAWLAGGRVRLDIAPDVVIEPGIRVQVRREGASLTIGRRCALRDGMILRLGGDIVIGDAVEIRQDVTLNVKGHLHVQGGNTIGRGTMIHADGRMVIEWGASCSEYVTIVDSHHDLDGSFVRVNDQGLERHDVTIGAGALLGAKATVLPGVRVGASCIIGSSAVVTKHIPDGYIAVGSPARALRPLVEAPLDA